VITEHFTFDNDPFVICNWVCCEERRLNMSLE